MSQLDLRLRAPSSGLLGLPWLEPLAEWDVTEVPLRDIPVGPSRHLVRFVETDGHLWALKELPKNVAIKEYRVLRELERRLLPAVRAAGLVVQPAEDTAVLVTRYLDRSWQYRRLLMRLPTGAGKHRERLLDAMASLLVDLHRNGVFWGDCSLANTLFSRDGQRVQAWMVDAETSEIHPSLSDGQRELDLGVLVENVAGGLVDLAARLGEQPEDYAVHLAEAESVVTRYQALWEVQHAQPVISFEERYRVDSQIRRLNELGFGVDEVRLEPAGPGQQRLRLKVAVAGRRFHADQLQQLTGLDAGEGQATVLLNDLRAYQSSAAGGASSVPEGVTARRWVDEVLRPGMARAHAAVDGIGDPVQAYCDLLEVRWLLSEQAGCDIGEEQALEALARRGVPADSAARMSVAEVPTEQFRALTPELMEQLDHTGAAAEEW